MSCAREDLVDDRNHDIKSHHIMCASDRIIIIFALQVCMLLLSFHIFQVHCVRVVMRTAGNGQVMYITTRCARQYPV